MNDLELESLRQRAQKSDPEALENYGLALLGASAPGASRFDEGLSCLSRAARTGRTSAMTALGHVYRQHPVLPDAPAEAQRCYQHAAAEGDPLAVERLADLYLSGYGVETDDARAFSLYSQLADYGFPSALCHAAYLHSEGLGCEADEAAAASLVLRAAAQGHTLAFCLAAHRYMGGIGVPEDPVIAAAWMELAAARGFPAAEELWQSWIGDLDEHSRSASRELAERLKANLRKLGARLRDLDVAEDHPEYTARFNTLVAQNYQDIGISELALDPQARGYGILRRPLQVYAPEVCCWSPRVFRVADFASAAERTHLLDLAQPLLRSTGDSDTTDTVRHVDAFDGDYAAFPAYVATPVVRNLLRRLASLVQVNTLHFEPMSVLRYSVGHQYAPHVDYFDGPCMQANRKSGDLGGQRIITAMIHLIGAADGGEIHYPAGDIALRTQPGTALMHYNTTPDGLADPRSRHQSQPVTAGEKWIARTAVRERSLDQIWQVL